jgi:hypothetical protein
MQKRRTQPLLWGMQMPSWLHWHTMDKRIHWHCWIVKNDSCQRLPIMRKELFLLEIFVAQQ